MKIEEGKYYRTRDGRKVGPMRKSKETVFMSEDNDHELWWECGTSVFVLGYDLVEEWREEPVYKQWKDLTDEEKGALLLAHHEGKELEHSGTGKEWRNKDSEYFQKNLYYRIKPEPVVDDIVVWVECIGVAVNIREYAKEPTHKITFQLIDGEPDCSSIKMEKL